MLSGRRSRWPVLALVLGCASCDPLIDVAGAFFPAWILCILFGIAVTVMLRMVFARTGIEGALKPLFFVYPSLATAVALTCWLLFFRR
jgi:hypothetical protein